MTKDLGGGKAPRIQDHMVNQHRHKGAHICKICNMITYTNIHVRKHEKYTMKTHGTMECKDENEIEINMI